MTSLIQPDRSQTLRRAAVRATLAPSIHNTQPWRFVLSADALEIHADRSRQLRVLDPRGRQMTISCGCALFNARASMAAAGYDPAVERRPDPMQPDLLARVLVGEPRRGWVPIGALDDQAERRHTNRRRFSDEPVPPADVAALVEAADSGGRGPVSGRTRRTSTVDRAAVAAGRRRSRTPIRPTEPSCAPGPPTTDGAATAYRRLRSRTLMRDPGTRYRSGTSIREEWAGCLPRRSPRCGSACYCWGPPPTIRWPGCAAARRSSGCCSRSPGGDM